MRRETVGAGLKVRGTAPAVYGVAIHKLGLQAPSVVVARTFTVIVTA